MVNLDKIQTQLRLAINSINNAGLTKEAFLVRRLITSLEREIQKRKDLEKIIKENEKVISIKSEKINSLNEKLSILKERLRSGR